MRTLAVRVAAALILFQIAGLPALGGAAASGASSANADCPVIMAAPVVTVAPNQPEVESGSTVGIINALCEVKLQIVGCLFSPTTVSIACDANGDGITELAIPLKNVTLVNQLLLEATLPRLEPQLSGTAFPLACCGGLANLTLSRTVGSGDDNVFGPFVQSQTCPIDLGIRAPVVISATPSDGDCAIAQNLVIPGSCFLLAGGKPNVTSVFAVEKNNPGHVIQSKNFVILNANLIDAFFEFGSASSGKTFLIYASGPNGTSRNLTALPAGTPQGCPLGNEQGVQVTFTCKGAGPTPSDSPPPKPFVASCQVERNSSGAFSLKLDGFNFREGQTLTVGGVTPKKLKFKNADITRPGFFTTIVAKGKVCKGLAGIIVVFDPSMGAGAPFACGKSCPD
ncbi:MAG TPA: hypothetical protein VFB82_09655 [Blastocatellia bacterium]|nr:hypothetical protein [Blastocatellia bacterium]